MKKTPKIIGISGGIGSGKSIICKVFERLGVPVYYADERAKFLTNNDLQLIKEIKELLGRQAYDEHGQYNRRWVSSQVFQNPELLTMLNALIHPRVYEDSQKWVLSQHAHPYLIREAAIIQANYSQYLDELIAVISPMNLRIERIAARDPLRTKEEIKAIIQRQRSDAEYSALSNHLIINDEKHLLLPQILKLHQLFSHQ